MKNQYFIDNEGFLLIESGPAGKQEFKLKKNIAAYFKTNNPANSLEIMQDSIWHTLCRNSTFCLVLCPGQYRLHIISGQAGLYVTGVDGLTGIGKSKADIME